MKLLLEVDSNPIIRKKKQSSVFVKIQVSLNFGVLRTPLGPQVSVLNSESL